ncbi:MAG: helix-hairpin-helix domain-containing protein, partial [Phycisphaerae bacterium]|nr:helix-hairpin-helix domain-containing protein [Phycisphaerae bacterium]
MRDTDDEVTVFDPNDDTGPYYGFETPCIYISEIAHSFYVDPNDPNAIHQSYAVELHRPYNEDNDPNGWRLVIRNSPNDVSVDTAVNWSGTTGFHVFRWIDTDPCTPVLDVQWFGPSQVYPQDGASGIESPVTFQWPVTAGAVGYFIYYSPDRLLVENMDLSVRHSPRIPTRNWYGPVTFTNGQICYWRYVVIYPPPTVPKASSVFTFTIGTPPVSDDVNTTNFIFDGSSEIQLLRPVGSGYITADKFDMNNVDPNWFTNTSIHSIQRDNGKGKLLRRLWQSYDSFTTLGYVNDYNAGGSDIQVHPSEGIVNIGQIGQTLVKSGYMNDLSNAVDFNDAELTARFDLAVPNFQRIFNYLTVWPPIDKVADPNETRIKGRININTAPWFVISQLPWVSDKLAQAIVAYRDKLDLSIADPLAPNYYQAGAPNARQLWMQVPYPVREEPGFASIGELMNVTKLTACPTCADYDIRQHGIDGNDLVGFPDLTPSDGISDDFEERDVVFARISNLVTVRSDIFTAYILVRIGTDGPQKRVVAIFDRSQTKNANDPVQLIAVHPVSDPR